MKRILTSAQMKSCDRREIMNGTPSEVLMRRAAAAVYERLCAAFDTTRVLFVCGGGNNGGDGLLAAVMLAEAGGSCRVMFTGDKNSCTEETKKCLARARAAGIEFTDEADMGAYSAVVDAMFGIGLSRPLEGTFAEAAERINKSGVPVLAVDIPSGVCADTGEIMGCAVRARETVTFAAYKRGLLRGEGAEYAGKIICADIGICCKDAEQYDSDTGVIPYAFEKSDLALIPPRKKDSNKGTYGRVLVAGGEAGMCGAVYLAALAAYRSGAGLVEIYTAEENRIPLQVLLPEAVITPTDWREPNMGVLDGALSRCRAVVTGPGMGRGAGAKRIIKHIYEGVRCPLIADADALNITASEALSFPRSVPVIITPHPLELSRLTGTPVSELREELASGAADYAKKTGVICTAKDFVTVITDGSNVFMNVSGSPALAKGGSGDVLAGVTAGLLCSGLSPLGAAGLGAYVHGLAGELAEKAYGVMSPLARETADYIAEVLKEAGCGRF